MTFCENCGAKLEDGAAFCTACGAACGAAFGPHSSPGEEAYVPAPDDIVGEEGSGGGSPRKKKDPSPGVSPKQGRSKQGRAVAHSPKNKRLACGLFLFLGLSGAHQFYLGNIAAGIRRLVLCAAAVILLGIIGGNMDLMEMADMMDNILDMELTDVLDYSAALLILLPVITIMGILWLKDLLFLGRQIDAANR